MELIDRISKEELAEQQQISRKCIKDTLEILSSIEEQLEYQRNVPWVNITVELVCFWFDDDYHPKNKIFLSAFSEKELQAMSDFNEVFEQILAPMQGDYFPAITKLVKTTEWKRLVQAAHDTLDVFEHRAGK